MSASIDEPAAQTSPAATIFEDLRTEQEQLEPLLAGLTPAAWSAPSAAPGWSIADVVLHLAQREEAIAATAAGPNAVDTWNLGETELDAAVDRSRRLQRDSPDVVFARWWVAHREARRDRLRFDQSLHHGGHAGVQPREVCR